ncbi:Fpg/Nei family DNA glycosylase [Saccharomonospora glauca]|uniref:DNA-(apurinic or apyrimidinic site) lyase n=1 Tax=Saccharomonospora glauca K62 TaxID=928724 RepID=I1D0I2_9PSEU|nr:DNA-formamidopyrimidine glycosylase family protein [Saccharomonospora glauca]EIE98456.1 formamidopyrimidine-DNA glycosylase [Saccharomonospora glauca K62]
MPEGHVVHRLARELGADLTGHRLSVSSPRGRFGAEAARLHGAVLRRTDAHGKHLLVDFSRDERLHVHLGMQGKWLRFDDPGRPALPQVRLRLASEVVAWDLLAPLRCELLSEEAVRDLVRGLGPDPLRSDADAEAAVAALRAAPGAVGAALLDQSVISGVGNVFRNEALHAVGIAPRRPCRELTDSEARTLWAELRRMMERAVEDGRIVTMDVPDRATIPESEARKVYKQKYCRDCGAPVVTDTVGGRTAYHCPREQPR